MTIWFICPLETIDVVFRYFKPKRPNLGQVHYKWAFYVACYTTCNEMYGDSDSGTNSGGGIYHYLEHVLDIEGIMPESFGTIEVSITE